MVHYLNVRETLRIIKMNTKTKDIIKFVLIVLGIVAFGLTIVNQGAGYFQKSRLLMNPCAVCMESNELVKGCVELITTPRGVQGLEFNYSTSYNISS